MAAILTVSFIVQKSFRSYRSLLSCGVSRNLNVQFGLHSLILVGDNDRNNKEGSRSATGYQFSLCFCVIQSLNSLAVIGCFVRNDCIISPKQNLYLMS